MRFYKYNPHNIVTTTIFAKLCDSTLKNHLNVNVIRFKNLCVCNVHGYANNYVLSGRVIKSELFLCLILST